MSTPAKVIFKASAIGPAPASDAGTWTPPASILYLPAGTTHVCAATPDGGCWEGDITVDESTCQALAAELQTAIAASDAGQGVRPYCDFQHEDAEASAIPTAFAWSPEGIRLELEWTSDGAEALAGRVYSYFSPTFCVDKTTGRPASLCLPGSIGSLVNVPAFGASMKIAAKQAEASARETVELRAQLATLTAAAASKDAELLSLRAELADANRKLDDLKPQAGVVIVASAVAQQVASSRARTQDETPARYRHPSKF